MMDNKIKCLYYIKDLRSDKIIYIGYTTDYVLRKYEHFGRKKQKIDLYMFNEGRDNFLMEIFTNIDFSVMTEDDFKKKEQELIEYYDTINNGYNKHRSGNIANITNKNNYIKQYYIDNRKDIIQRSTNNLKNNRERHNEYMRQYRLRKKINTMSE